MRALECPTPPSCHRINSGRLGFCFVEFKMVSLVSVELQRPLESYLLPLLSARELAKLACSFVNHRTWLFSVDPNIWRDSCNGVLPPTHPGSKPQASFADVLNVLQNNSKARHNIAAAPSAAVFPLPSDTQSPQRGIVLQLFILIQIYSQQHLTFTAYTQEPCYSLSSQLMQ